jgi:ribosome-binding factor A
VGNLIRGELAELIARRVKDPRVSLVTLTEVDVSPDMRRAVVYYSVLDASRREEAHNGLSSALPFLQGQIGSRLRMKVIPRLEIAFDDSLAHGAAMDQLIDRVRAEDQAAAQRRGEQEADSDV